jgi:rod shape-determining protein MreC
MRGLSRRQRLGAIVLAAVASAFIVLDVAGSGLHAAHGGVRGALGALYRGTDGVIGPVRRFAQGVPGAASNRDTIDKLRRENAALKAQVAADSADARTKSRLARLQLAADTGRYRIVPARVIALGPGQGFDWTVTLDVGSDDGLRAGQTVTDGVALVGRVLSTNTSSSAVLLAADPGSGVGARDTRNGQLGVATGHGSAGFTLTPLAPDASVQVGDTLRTGPAGRSTYVPGLAIGTVTAVDRSGDGAVRASVHPAASPTALDLVGVILLPSDTTTRRPALTPSRVAGAR